MTEINLQKQDDDLIEINVPKRRRKKQPIRERASSPIKKRQHENRMLAQHSSESREHYTPEHIIKVCRELMGHINLDPASTHLANTVVQADKYLTMEEDGLSKPWFGNVYLNPPGGDTTKLRPELKDISRSYPCIWWGKLLHEWLCGNVNQACFMVFQLNLLQTIQKVDLVSLTFFDFPIVFFKDRLKFNFPLDTQDGLPVENTELRVGEGPPGGSALVWIPPLVKYKKEPADWSRFADLFSEYGKAINLNVCGL
jgi:hypothetical protein